MRMNALRPLVMEEVVRPSRNAGPIVNRHRKPPTELYESCGYPTSRDNADFRVLRPLGLPVPHLDSARWFTPGKVRSG